MGHEAGCIALGAAVAVAKRVVQHAEIFRGILSPVSLHIQRGQNVIKQFIIAYRAKRQNGKQNGMVHKIRIENDERLATIRHAHQQIAVARKAIGCRRWKFAKDRTAIIALDGIGQDVQRRERVIKAFVSFSTDQGGICIRFGAHFYIQFSTYTFVGGGLHRVSDALGRTIVFAVRLYLHTVDFERIAGYMFVNYRLMFKQFVTGRPAYLCGFSGRTVERRGLPVIDVA